MILQSLNELYTRLADDPSYKIAPPGFAPQKISFRIVIRPGGSLVAIEDARVKNVKGKLNPDRLEVPAHEKRTCGIKAQFLCDKTEYLLGRQIDGKREGSGAECFEEFKKVHLSFEQSIKSPSFSALCRFLENWLPEEAKNHSILNQIGTNFGVFQIQGARGYLHDDPNIKDWWIRRQLTADCSSAEEQCLVTGEVAPICRIHPDIKGFKSSIALVGIQVNTSYESYGRSKTENCPISEEVAFRYATALNSLLDGPHKAKHRIYIGGTTAVFWTEKPTIVEDCLAGIFNSGSLAPDEVQDNTKRKQLQRLLEAVRSGKRYQDLGELDTPFYILGLEQPNPGRFSIRFFHRSTVVDLLARLHDHQRCFEMIRQYTEANGNLKPDPDFPSIMDILKQTPPPKNGWPDEDKIPPLLGGALARAIIEGTPYPEGLFSAIIRRIHADRTINYLRAATLKAVLIRNHNQTIPTMLDTENTDPAYLHGRLFATLEKIQEEGYYAQSNQQIKSTIKEKYFSSACSTPAAIFPRLETLSVHHQRHLNPGRKGQFDKLTSEIKWPLSGTKKTHTLIEQGNFILGYYHQRKDFFTKKESTSTTETVTENA